MPEPSLYLFDGSNLFHAGGFSDRDELVDLLSSYVATRGARGVIVFDGVGADRAVGPLEVRFARQTESAQALVERLRSHPAVSAVRYPGFGALLSFDVADAESARAVESATRLVVNMTSLGGVTSRIEARARWEGERVPPGLLRLSVGLEDPDTLWADLEQALARV